MVGKPQGWPSIPQEELDRVKRESDIVGLIGSYVKLEKAGAEYKGLCPFHSEKTPSFRVSPSKQFYHCHGCGAHGDVLDFLIEHAGMRFRDAASALGARVPDGQAAASLPAPREMPPPPAEHAATPDADDDRYQRLEVAGEDMPPPPKVHVKLGKPGSVHTYYRADGAVHGHVYRFVVRRPDGSMSKETWPVTPWLDNGKPKWRWRAMAEPRPLYGLHDLATALERMPAEQVTVLLVEGEKPVDAAKPALAAQGVTDVVVMSWPGGCKAAMRPDRNDWAPLAGLRVVQWPDCDSKHVPLTAEEAAAGVEQTSKPLLPEHEQPGVAAMDAIGQVLLGMGCSVSRVSIAPPGSIDDGWDIADAIDQLEPEEWLGMLYGAQPWEPKPAETKAEPAVKAGPPALTVIDGGKADDAQAVGGWTIGRVLAEFALIIGSNRVWHHATQQEMAMAAMRQLVGIGPAKEWQALAVGERGKLGISRQDISRVIAEARAREVIQAIGGMSPFERYVVLDGTPTIYDRVLDEVVTVPTVKLALGSEAFKFWDNGDKKKIPYTHLVFDPTETCPAEYINTFKPDWPKYFKADGYTEKLPPQDAINFFDGCKNIIKLSLQLCNYDISVWTWLMCWLAYPLQNPGTKLDTAVIVASPENGTGKSMLFDVIMRRIYGKYSVMIGATQLASQYNPWAENALLAIGEEMTDPADPQGNAARLKLMITGFEQVVEAKFLNGRLVRNYMNMVLLSNLITVVSIDLTDRRYLCISPEHILTEAEQSVLEKEINGDGIEWFYSFLMSIKTEYLRKQANSTTLNYDSISFHQHSKPVMTVAKQTMARLSMSNWELFFEMWRAGELVYQHQNGEEAAIPFGPVVKDELYPFFEAWARRENAHRVIAKTRFFHMSSGKGGSVKGQWMNINGDRRQRTIWFPKGGDNTPAGAESREKWIGESVVSFRDAVSEAYGVDVTQKKPA